MSLISGTKGQLLRVIAFPSSGTWTKGNDVGMIQVQVIGGGGGGGYSINGSSGGSSNFGSHCSASGGDGGLANVVGSTNITRSGGNGGVGNSGDINFQGERGEDSHVSAGSTYKTIISNGGSALIPNYGNGGSGFYASAGGAGGCSIKIINESSLGSSETISVGSGGSNGTSSYPPGVGRAGIVIVYEYSK